MAAISHVVLLHLHVDGGDIQPGASLVQLGDPFQQGREVTGGHTVVGAGRGGGFRGHFLAPIVA
ncbi:MAG: hypothetical protein DRP42_07615 [Tenericutes bacterium]|nr:MAG: hypothetical protein DRP42_07615 [Mycoplasmatota bacterium]